MPRIETRTVLILRRMKRVSLSTWPWSFFTPIKARPNELTFDMLDRDGRTAGQIQCTRFDARMLQLRFSARTPWGVARVDYSKHGPTVFLNDRELVVFKASALKSKADFVFPSGTVMMFDRIRGRRNDIVYTGPDGTVGFFEEEGTLKEGARNRPIPLTREEIKALPKEDRPRSIETNDYVQYTISVGGRLPEREEDIVRGLCILGAFGRLVEEIPA